MHSCINNLKVISTRIGNVYQRKQREQLKIPHVPKCACPLLFEISMLKQKKIFFCKTQKWNILIPKTFQPKSTITITIRWVSQVALSFCAV